MSISIEAGIKAAQTIDQIGTGYDWGDLRWSFNPSRDGKTFVPNKDGDCSSICGSILKAIGVPVDLTGWFSTHSFRVKAVAAGCTAISVKGQNLSQIASQLRVGDFLLAEQYHVEFCTGPGQIFSGHINEAGKPTGGKPGDQTGLEVGYSPLYQYSTGWEHIIRPPAPATTLQDWIDKMKATHIQFSNSGKTYIASILAGTYTHVPNPQALKDQQSVIRISGGKLATWQSLVGGKTNIANPQAFGIEIKA